MRRLAPYCTVLALSLSWPVHAAAPSAAPKLSADECAVWARELGFAQSLAEHDAAAFKAHLHPGAVFGAKRADALRGAEAIAQGWAPLIEGKALRLQWYPTMVAIGGEADTASSSGPALYEDLRPEATPRYRIGGFQSIWHKGADGVWRVLFDDGLDPRPASEAEVAAFHAGHRTACPQA